MLTGFASRLALPAILVLSVAIENPAGTDYSRILYSIRLDDADTGLMLEPMTADELDDAFGAAKRSRSICA